MARLDADVNGGHIVRDEREELRDGRDVEQVPMEDA